MRKLEIPQIKISYERNENVKEVLLKDPDTVYEYLLPMYDQDTFEMQEESIIIFMNGNNQAIGYYKLAKGGKTHVIIDQRILFGIALKCGATGVIISHNHPSGSLNFSDEDITVTENLVTVGKIVGVTVLDHIIVTKRGYSSMVVKGII